MKTLFWTEDGPKLIKVKNKKKIKKGKKSEKVKKQKHRCKALL